MTANQAKRYITCRALSGVLVRNGTPISNAIIIRTLTWNGTEKGVTDYFETDNNGHFHIPQAEQFLAISPLTQFVAKANIKVQNGSEQSDLWYEVLMNEQPNIIGDISRLRCEFGAEAKRIFSESGLLGTVCTWDNMPEEEDPYAI